nr:MAG TPA: restriction alleviation protein [Caudoviricetes sp.]
MTDLSLKDSVVLQNLLLLVLSVCGFCGENQQRKF